VRRAPAGTVPVHATTLADLAKPPATGLRLTWMGHSSVLAEIDGHRVLFDPVWGERCSPFPFAGPKRLHPVPLPLAALGPVDVVVISHDHYDHLDMPTIKALADTDTVFAVPLGVGAHLEHWGVSRRPAARAGLARGDEGRRNHPDRHPGPPLLRPRPAQHPAHPLGLLGGRR
jgi:glyoxylase-like metal-dependent hydrolase (beta-lactamase superfamily II)